MRSKISILLTFFIVCFCVQAIIAEAEKPKAQLYFTEEATVKPSMFGEYEKVIKEMVALCKENNYSYPFLTYVSNDFHYYFVYPIESSAEIEKIFKSWYGMMEKVEKEKWQPLDELAAECVKFMELGMFQHKPELSFSPEGYELNLEEEPFVYWGFCSPMPGKEKAVEETFKKYVSLYKEKNIGEAFETFIVNWGKKLPLYFYMLRAKSAPVLFGNSEKAQKIAEKELSELWAELMSLCREYEGKLGYYRPDFSYMPEAK